MRFAILALLLSAALAGAQQPEWDDVSVLHVGDGKAPRDDDGLPVRRTGEAGRPREIAVVPVAQRKLEIPRLLAAGRPSARLLSGPASTTRPGAPFRCRRAGRCTASTSRSTPTSSTPGRRTPEAARGAARVQPGGLLPHALSPCPPAWKGRQVYLHFEGVDSAFYVWVNGTKVGYNEDSRTPAEFDITPLSEARAQHLLAVEVYRFGDGAFLEDQDMWRMSGIYRDVYLWSAGRQHVRDFEVQHGSRRRLPRRQARR